MAYSWDAGARPSDGMDYELMDDGTAWKCVKCWKKVDDGHLAGKDHQKNLAWYVNGPGNPGRQAPQQAAGRAACGAVAAAAAAAAGPSNQPPQLLGPWQQPQQALQDVPWPRQDGLWQQQQQALQDGQPPQQPGGQPVGPPQQGQQPHQQPGGQLVGQPKAVPPSPPWERGIERRLDRVEELVMEMRDTLERLEALALRQQELTVPNTGTEGFAKLACLHKHL